jgi:hypothetical protein
MRTTSACLLSGSQSAVSGMRHPRRREDLGQGFSRRSVGGFGRFEWFASPAAPTCGHVENGGVASDTDSNLSRGSQLGTVCSAPVHDRIPDSGSCRRTTIDRGSRLTTVAAGVITLRNAPPAASQPRRP